VPNILRTLAACRKIGIGKTYFTTDFVLKHDNDRFVPGTDNTVRRVRPVRLGERAVGFFSDELDSLAEALRQWRDSKPTVPRKEPEQLRTGRDAWRERVNKRRAATSQHADAE
jgi:hypothetical protein